MKSQPLSPSLSATLLKEVSPEMFHEVKCLSWLFQNIHPERYACPDCGREIEDERILQRFCTMGRVRCGNCRRSFDWRTGTILEGTSLSAPEIVFLGLLLEVGTPIREVAERLRVDRNTVRDWRDRLRFPGGHAFAGKEGAGAAGGGVEKGALV